METNKAAQEIIGLSANWTRKRSHPSNHQRAVAAMAMKLENAQTITISMQSLLALFC
jgi:hypothetical protein